MVDAISFYVAKFKLRRLARVTLSTHGTLLALLLQLTLGSCQETSTQDSGDFLQKALAGNDTAIKKVMDKPEHFELQMQLILPQDSTLFGSKKANREQMNRTETSVIDHSQGQYFYPASTVKLPVAILAAEWAELQPHINIITPYQIENDSVNHTIAQDLIEIFAVSDNQAYNRLYDLLGRDYINQRMAELGFNPFRLAHRLSVSDAGAPEHPIYFFDTDQGQQTVQATEDRAVDTLTIKGTQKGVGYMQDELLVHKPMDFSGKNYFPLETMMQFMQALFPLDCRDCPSVFKWSKNTEAFVKTLMSGVPRKQGYNESEYPDGYVKFFFLGDTKERIDPTLKIHNKVGYAYGTLTDIAYVVDTKHKLHYLMGATLLVNENGIFNDNTYEYETIGLPFLAQVSRRVHQLLIEAKSGG